MLNPLDCFSIQEDFCIFAPQFNDYMRPRIKSSNQDVKITYSDMNKYLTENRCFSTTVRFIDKNTAEYSFLLMFRDNKKPPVEAKVKVSLVSKLVLSGSIGDVPCASVREFMDKCKWRL